MKARPILMAGSMVRTTLREVEAPGTGKTQTRRVIKPQHLPFIENMTNEFAAGNWAARPMPYGHPGDLLWVREAWTGWNHNPDEPGCAVVYRASCDNDQFDYFEGGTVQRMTVEGWRPSIHMPRWASRLTLRITDVRVERVQEISREDAVAEGIERVGGEFSVNPWRNYLRGTPGEMDMECSDPRRSFQTLWDSINAARGYPWESNCWVWALTFEPVLENVDAVLAREAA